MGLIIGYARTSTVDQVAGFDAQVRDLTNAGCTKIFSEQVSSRDDRPEMEKALAYLRDDDVLVVTKIDRLARSMRDLVSIVDRIAGVKASLRILAIGLDTNTSTGRLILNVFGSLAEWERDQMLERQREGIAKAKVEGKYKGRKPSVPADRVHALHKSGMGPAAIARELKVGRASVYRAIAARRTLS